MTVAKMSGTTVALVMNMPVIPASSGLGPEVGRDPVPALEAWS